MGAYENPVTVVDTQSGQIWANAIQNLGAQTSNILDQERNRLLEENKDFSIRLRKIQEDGIKNYDIIAGSLAEKGITDQQIYDQAQKFQTEKTNASTKLMQTGRPPEELAEAQKQYNQSDKALKGLVPYIKARGESLEDYLREVGGNPVNVGQQGYASMTENQDFQIGTWIDSGYLKGSKEIVYDKEKGWGTKYKESEDIDTKYDGKEFTIWGTQAADYTTTKVPFVDKGLENVLLETGIIDKNGKLTSDYQYFDSKQTRTEKSKDGSITAVIVGPNWERAAVAIDKKVNDIADGYLKTPSIANAVWRNVFGEKEDMKIVDGGGVDPEQARIFKEKLKLRAGQYIPNVDYVASDDPKAAKWIQENPGAFENKSFGVTPKPKTSPSDGKGGVSSSQINILTELSKVKYPRTSGEDGEQGRLDIQSKAFTDILANKGFKAGSLIDGEYIEIKNNKTNDVTRVSNEMTNIQLNNALAKLAGVDPAIVDKIFNFDMGPKNIDQFDFSEFKVSQDD